jgi:hypothetical protein
MKIAIVVFSAAVVIGLLTTARGDRSISPLRELVSPATSPSAQPQLVVDAAGRVILSWIEDVGKTTARAFRYSYRDGDRWTAPTTIVERDRFFVNWADVPSVFPMGGGRLAAHWLQYNGPGTYAYDVRLAFSDAQGKNWSADTTPHRDRSNTEHGFASFFAAPGGGAGVVWLDGRAMSGTHGGAHGAMTLRATTIAPDGNIGDEVRLDARVCECCPTTAVATASGALVAYRDRSHREVRDIAVARLHKGVWQPPALVHADNWKIDACPVNGPAVAASGDHVALAWFTAEGDKPRVNVAFSDDGGTRWGAPIRVDEAKSLGRVDTVLLDDGRAVVLWMEHLDSGSELRARIVAPTGARDSYVTIASMAANRQSGYARMVRTGHDLVFAWVSNNPTSQVTTAVSSLIPRY